MKAPLALERAVLERSGRREGAEIRFRCPFPDRHQRGDARPSARFHREKQVWHCDVCGEGGGWKELASLLKVPFAPSGFREPAAIYEYRSEQGDLLRWKLRWVPGFAGRAKSFTWEKPDGTGGWAKCQGDGNPGVLYRSERLPATRAAGGRVFVVEGEKDADRAAVLGLMAVTNPEGAGRGKWRSFYSEQLRGLEIIVIPDRDEPGRDHAYGVVDSLQGVAASVRVLELPGEGVKDLSDWIEAEERSGQVREAVRARLLASAGAAPTQESSGVPAATPDLPALLAELEALPDEPDLDAVGDVLRRLAERVSGLAPLDRELARERAIRALQAKVKAPGRLVDAALRSADDPTEEKGQGRALLFEELEPWPEPVHGADLLTEIEETFLRFVSLPEGAAIALALWVLLTYNHDTATVSPLLALTSPEKRCGKTTTLSLLGALVSRPLPASNVTPAALFRAIEAFSPTLLIDEADSFLGEREELRGILNSGHTRATAFVLRTVGDEHEPRQFSTWAPKAVALIGRLASTLEDRSIAVPMKRKAPGEQLARLRLDRLNDLADLRRNLRRWSEDHRSVLAG